MKNKMFLAVFVSILVALGFIIGLNVVDARGTPKSKEHATIAHPVGAGTPTPTPPIKFVLPFDRNQKSVITTAPGQGLYHINASAEAIDFSPRGWTTVRAAKTGDVYIKGFLSGGWGNTVVLEHNDGFFSFYPHLAAASSLSVGAHVEKYATIGTVGMTGGTSTGVHAHLEVRDQMTNNSISTGSSVNHPVRRIPGVGFFPWFIHDGLNPGYTGKSTTHPVGKCLSDNTITVEWLNPNEYDHYDGTVEEIDGFSYKFSPDPNYIPPKIMDSDETIYSVTSDALTLSQPIVDWYFHLRVKSVNYGWAGPSQVSHQGPYKLSYTCPSTLSEGDWNPVPGEDE